MLVLFISFFIQQYKFMGCFEELDQIKVEKMQMLFGLCFYIFCEDQIEVGILQGEVFIIRGQRDCGEMFFQVVYVFYYLFYYMERFGVLDLINEIYLFVFYFVFVLRINKKLMLFWEGYNRGLISFEYNFFLEQLWVCGILFNVYSD